MSTQDLPDLWERMAAFDPATATTEHTDDGLDDLLAAARQHCPAVRAHSGQHGEYVLVTSDALAREVGRDHTRFSARSGIGASNAAGIGNQSDPNCAPLFGQDPHLSSGDPLVDQVELRRRLQPLFTPRASRSWRVYAATLARMRARELVGRGQCEAVRELAHWIPAYIAGALLGVPRRDRPRYRTLATRFFADDASECDHAALYRYLREVLALRRDQPGQDAVSIVLAAGASEQQALEFAVLFSAAGTLTSGDSLATLLHWLACDHELQQQMRSHPDRLPALVDEAARLRGAVATSGRTVTSPTRLGDLELAAGEQVLVCWYAAGADPARHPEANQIRLDRRPRDHSGWGAGAHRCLGQHIAQTTIASILGATLEILPAFAVDPAVSAPRRTFGQLSGLDQLPLIWAPPAD
ncbi:cytochrome P450 [Saccharopolyspora griseoalba]|uniref:Cytochrome P450 n=1 Tax=Saccharopolyspora griseoalba TaxID=1431848 RepID=A0ABW2LV93_9PSEU